MMGRSDKNDKLELMKKVNIFLHQIVGVIDSVANGKSYVLNGLSMNLCLILGY